MEQTENKQVTSRRQAFLDKMRESNPDINYEDDEAIFGAIDDNMSSQREQLDKYENESKRIVDMMSANPRAAQFFNSWSQGEDPVISMLEAFGDDFKNALDDPKNKDKFAQAHKKWLDNTAKNKELQKSADDNMVASFDVLENLMQQEGWTDEQAISVFNRLHQIISDGIVNKIDPETYVMVYKAMNYDNAVADAEQTGEIRGRNAKIGDMKRARKAPEDVPPTISAGAEPTKAPDTKVYNNPFVAGGKVRK